MEKPFFFLFSKMPFPFIKTTNTQPTCIFYVVRKIYLLLDIYVRPKRHVSVTLYCSHEGNGLKKKPLCSAAVANVRQGFM